MNKAGKSDLNSLAAAVGQQVQTAEGVSFISSVLGNSGMEQNIVGRVVTMKQGQISKPLKGTSGVYVVMVNSINEPTVPKDLKEIKATLAQQFQQRTSYEAANALREKANIDDRRGRFY
jgi:hypothetical protein